ncbi:unnamed protein product [Ectocarpus sp. 13 AM-2016]
MTFTAVSIVMSTLLASPRVEALVPSFGGRGFNMVSALIPPHGRAANSTPSTVAGGTPTGPARVFDGSRGHPKRSPTGTTALAPSSGAAAAPPSGDADDAHQEHHHHPASAVYFDDVGDHAEPSQLPGPPYDQRDLPAGPPEPGGGVDHRHRAKQLESAQRSGALPAAYHRPWRQRARDARRQTVFENNPEEGFEAEEGGGGSLVGARRRRASEKEEVVASRKDSQQKAINRAALPIVDLVGLVSPLVLIAGMTMVHIVP